MIVTLLVVAGYCVGCLAAWDCARDGRSLRPFSWRILWMPAYYRWLNRRLRDMADARCRAYVESRRACMERCRARKDAGVVE